MTNNKQESHLIRILDKLVKNAFSELKRYFNVMPDKESEEDTIRNINNGVSFHGANLWVLVFAIFIASLGLNVNSTAVIIGAMLISPLMGPIIGMGMAVGINDFEMLKRSFKNYIVATVISVVTATVYFLLTPLTEAQSELLARTSPTLYDVFIALCGGAAGIVALATKGKGNVLPGVAIATALMPPLCTAGFGLATGNILYFLGAFYLFFINTVFICLATYLGVRMMKFKEIRFVDSEHYVKVRRYIVIIVTATMIPAGIMTFSIVKDSIFKTNVDRFVREQLEGTGTRIISYDVNRDSLILRTVAVGREIPDSTIKNAEMRMSEYKIGRYTLQVIQGTQSDSLIMLNRNLTNAIAKKDDYSEMLHEKTVQISGLQNELRGYTRLEDMTPAVAKEMRALFDGVNEVSLSLASRAVTDTSSVKRYTMIVVGLKPEKGLTGQERKRMKEWLEARLGTDSLRLITTTSEN